LHEDHVPRIEVGVAYAPFGRAREADPDRTRTKCFGFNRLMEIPAVTVDEPRNL
jgi:hypothetical protein